MGSTHTSSISFTTELVQSIQEQLPDQIKRWTYDGTLFREARQNIQFLPAAMPALYHILNTTHKIPTAYQAYKTITSYPDYDCPSLQHARARIYQFHCGWLRELDVVLKIHRLKPQATITYDPQIDTGKGGIDLTVTEPGYIRQFAIKHTGKARSQYQDKKDAKKAAHVIELWSSKTEGQEMDLVDVDDILLAL